MWTALFIHGRHPADSVPGNLRVCDGSGRSVNGIVPPPSRHHRHRRSSTPLTKRSILSPPPRLALAQLKTVCSSKIDIDQRSRPSVARFRLPTWSTLGVRAGAVFMTVDLVVQRLFLLRSISCSCERSGSPTLGRGLRRMCILNTELLFREAYIVNRRCGSRTNMNQKKSRKPLAVPTRSAQNCERNISDESMSVRFVTRVD